MQCFFQNRNVAWKPSTGTIEIRPAVELVLSAHVWLSPYGLRSSVASDGTRAGLDHSPAQDMES